MQERTKQFILGRIEREWKSLPDEFRPWGVWVRYYAPLPADVVHLGAGAGVPLRAWFLDKNGMGERSVWEFRRFIVVHFEQPWCGRIWEEPSIPINTKRYEIGMAAFAQYEGGSDVYLDWVWGGLFGRGWRVKFGEDGVAVDYHALWIS